MDQEILPAGAAIMAVINPISGGINKEDLEQKIAESAEKRGFKPHFMATGGEKDGKALARMVKTVSPARVLVFGGDGTVSMVARVLVETGIPLGIIPMGSGNGLAKDLGIPLNIEE